LTNHGAALRDFTHDYLPSYPRTVNWRDYRPRVAIVRLTDGDCGQATAAFRNRLLGNAQHPSDAVSREWLKVWPILTHGAAKSGGISLACADYSDPLHYPFFVPCDSVAVFDHTVTGPVLDSVECFIVCGSALSAPTFKAIAARVQAGATCIIAQRLYDAHAAGGLPGNWHLLSDFNDPRLANWLQPFLGPADRMRFRFRNCTVDFRQDGSGDRLAVEVLAPSNAVPVRTWMALAKP
jgi:hypothetical protein